MQVRLLHISDLHIRDDRLRDQQVIIRAFLRDVARLHRESKFDFVILSGDTAFGGAASEYALARDALIDPLMTILDLDTTRLIPVPGNHDVDVRLIDPYAEEGLARQLRDRDAVNAFSDSDFAEIHLRRLSAYDQFRATLAPSAPSLGLRGHFHSIQLRDGSVGVAALDSAWRATGAPGDADKGQILVGDRQLQAAVETVQTSSLRIAVMHHPLDWLKAFEGNSVRTQLEKHFDLVLTGHIHRDDPAQVATTRGGCIYLQGGALYESRSSHNSFSAVTVDSDRSVTVDLRAYSDARDEFDKDTSLVADGRITFSFTPKSVTSDDLGPSPRPLLDVAYNDIVGALISKAQSNSVIADRVADLKVRSLDDLLVAPVFLPVPYAQAVAAVEDKDEKVAEVDALALLRRGAPLLVVAEREAGLTNSLLWLLEKRFATDAARVPVYLNFRDLLGGRGIKRLLRDALSDVGISTAEDRLPPLVVAFDDVEPSQRAAFDRMAKYISEDPDSLFILGCKEDVQRDLSATLRNSAIGPERVFLGPFGRRHLRRLLAKVATDVAPHVDTILHCVVAENLPRTPFVMAALVAVMSVDEAINESLSETALLERYTSLLLNRWGAPEDPKVDLDYRSREHILGEFAAELTDHGRRELNRLETERFLVEYFEKRGWQGSAVHVLDDLVERRVLMEMGDSVSFRHGALRELFVGKLMNDDEEFAQRILQNPIEEASAIKHAAALKRSDEGLLTSVSEFGRALLARMHFPTGPALFETPDAMLMGSDDDDDESLQRGLEYEPPTEEHKDDMWDELEAEQFGISEEQEEMSAAEETFRGLHLWGLVLRYSELVAQVPLKSALLKEQVIAWGQIANALYAYESHTGGLKELFLELREEAGGKPDEDSQADARRIEALSRVIIASHVGMFAVQALGTKKLARPLMEVLDDPEVEANSGALFFATLLYCHIEGEGWPERLRTLFQRYGDHFTVRSMARSIALHHYHVSKSLSSQDRAVIESLIVDIVVRERPLRGGSSAAELARAKNNVVTRLRASRQRVQHTQKSDVVEPYLMRDVTDPYNEQDLEEA